MNSKLDMSSPQDKVLEKKDKDLFDSYAGRRKLFYQGMEQGLNNNHHRAVIH